MPNEDRVMLVGLDVGSTTSRMALAEAHVVRGAATRRPELASLQERFRPEPILTPFVGEALDLDGLLGQLDGWLAAAGVRPADLFGGGALVTGLAARAPNAGKLVEEIRARVGDAVVAMAGDPRLEAWLAFQGSVGELSRAAPSQLFLNLDIGGGTTNLAAGRGGEVLATGWSWVGARHVQVEPGTYRLTRCSPEGRVVMAHLGIDKGPGDELERGEVEVIVAVWVDLLEAAVSGREPRAGGGLTPARLSLPAHPSELSLAFSGGVGGLVHALHGGHPVPGTSHWGDLGIDLARKIAASAVLMARVVVPDAPGRATVYGLLRHQTQVPGSTVYLPNMAALPVGDLPILGSIGPTVDEPEIRRVLALSRTSPAGGCVCVRPPGGAAALRALGQAIGEALREAPEGGPLLLLVPQNLGKALGGYATNWGRSPLALVVLDEVAPGGAHLVHVGRPHAGVIPLSFHSLS